MEIKELTEEKEDLWEEYVKDNMKSNFFHQLGWKKVIEKTFGMKSKYIFLEDQGEIKGIMPLFIANNKLISLPFATEGGVVANNLLFEKNLIEKAIEITKDENLKLVELRQQSSVNNDKLKSLDIYFNLVLKLEEDVDLIWKSLDRKARNSTRKAKKSGVKVREGNVDEFYNIFSVNMRDLGTPVDRKEFFITILKEFPEQAKILVAEYENKPVATMFMLYFKKRIRVQWASSLRQYKSISPNNLLYWEAIKKACGDDLKYFDFGKSMEGEGTFNFKKKWGAKPEQMFYYFYLNKVKNIPDINKKNIKRQLFSIVWKKIPLSIANKIGPLLRERFA